MKARYLAAALLLAASPAQADLVTVSVSGHVAPYTWNGSSYTSTPLIDAAGVFGTTGEALFGDPFSVLWTIDTAAHTGTAVLTINTGSVNFGPHAVTLNSSEKSLYANVTITPAVRAMNTFVYSDVPLDFPYTVNPLTDNLTFPHHLGGSFRYDGVWGYLYPEQFTLTNLSAPLHVPGPAVGAGLPGLLMLFALWRRRRCARLC